MPRGIWTRPSDAEKLAARCVRDEATGCLNCEGASWRGYPRAMVAGRQMRSNRAAWILARGPIPDRMHVLHRCDNPKCVEIGHLFLGTHQDNMDDKLSKGRQPRGERVAISKLTSDQVSAIYADPRYHHVIAAEYGVSRRAVGMIKSGRNWRHVTSAAV